MRMLALRAPFGLAHNGLRLATGSLSGFLLDIRGDTILDRLWVAFIAALIISIISGVLNWFLKDTPKR